MTMKKFFLITLVLFSIPTGIVLLGSSSASSRAAKLLEQNGISNAQMTGYRFFGCGKDDIFHSGFSGTAVNGTPTSGVVCSGWFKGQTIRFD